MRKNHLFILSALSALGLCASCTTPRSTPNSSYPRGEKESGDTRSRLVGEIFVDRFVLSNGLKLLVIEDHSSPTFAYQTWFNVGSRNEIPQYTGLAHLFEHMMFKGTQKYPAGHFDKTLEKAGAEGLNAFTSRDYTAYVQELPKSQIGLIVDLESTRMHQLVVDDQAFKTEREVVQNERRLRTENNPDGTLFQELFELGFTVHPYRWPVIGYQEDLARMTGKDGEKFYRDYYAPNHATIVVSGDVNAREVYRLVERAYGGLQATQPPALEITPEPELSSPRRKTVPLTLQVEKILIGYRIPPEISPESAQLSVLSVLMGTGKSSRLHRALVETGIATQTFIDDLDNKDPSLLVVGASLQAGKSATSAEAAILKEMDRIKTGTISPEELARAKNQVKFAFYEGLAGNYSKAAFVGKYETIAGDYQKGLSVIQEIEKVTADQVQEVAKKYLIHSRRTVVVGVPKK
jgi:zinc protease